MKSKIIIEGGHKLTGQIKISGSKNAALPIMAAAILANEEITLENLPHLADISTMSHLLVSLGVKIGFKGHGNAEDARGKTIILNAKNITNFTAEFDIVSKMRASILVLGPLIAKYHQAKISLPGGCAIGTRPVNLHLAALEKLGAKIKLAGGYIEAAAPKGLVGTEIDFPLISVGATENTIMAAALAQGRTIINNAAIEPEILDLINFLTKLGVEISVKERQISVIGQKTLKATSHVISPDRIEAGSYAAAILATKGSAFFPKITAEIFQPIKKQLEACGAKIDMLENGTKITYQENNLTKDFVINTKEYPGFPTDMQAQFAALLLGKKFNSQIIENIFENRFMYVPELNRMGANITIKNNLLNIKPQKLIGTEVKASDLRASMSLIIAALVAKGTTTIYDTHHLDRGYEFLEEKLARLGANIYRENYL